MKILIVEDDNTSSRLIERLLTPFGDCELAVDGKQGLEMFTKAFEASTPYDLICLDVKMPELDGQQALAEIRKFEAEHGIVTTEGAKIIMTTAVSDSENVIGAFMSGCEAYVVKPISRKALLVELEKLGLVQN